MALGCLLCRAEIAPGFPGASIAQATGRYYPAVVHGADTLSIDRACGAVRPSGAGFRSKEMGTGDGPG